MASDPIDKGKDESAGPLAEALRKSGARRSDVGGMEAYQANQGTVVIGSPADMARAGIYNWRSKQRPSQAVVSGIRKALEEAGEDWTELDADWGQEAITPDEIAFPYIFRWDRDGRKDQPCNVLARDTLSYPSSFVLFKLTFGQKKFNSVLLKFADGFTMVVSGNSIRKR